METGGGEGVVSSLTRLGQDTPALWSPHHHPDLRDLGLLREEGGAYHHHPSDRGDPHRSALHHHEQHHLHHGLLWVTTSTTSPEDDSNNSHHIISDVDLDKEEQHQHHQQLYHHLHHHQHHNDEITADPPPPPTQTPPLLFLDTVKQSGEGDGEYLQEASPRPLTVKVVGIPEFLQHDRKEEFLGGEKSATADFLGGKMGEEFLEDPEDDDQGDDKEGE